MGMAAFRNIKAFHLERMQFWRIVSPYWALALILLVTLVLRLPYFFLSSEERMWRYGLLFDYEALFMLHGRDVLDGFLPYMRHWDNRPALGWFAYAILNLLSGENLVAFRFIGALYVGFTGFIIYHLCYLRGHQVTGLIAGIFYGIFCSVGQAGQSVTYGHVTGLPLALLLYYVLNGRVYAWHRLRVAALYAVCSMVLTNFVVFGVLVALLLPYHHADKFLSSDGRVMVWPEQRQTLRNFLCNVAFLSAVLFLGYALLFLLYWVYDAHMLLFDSIVYAPLIISGQTLDAPFFSGLFGHVIGFGTYFTRAYVDSREWLVPLFLSVFFVYCASVALSKVHARDVFSMQLLACLVIAVVVLFFRGGVVANSPYYLLQMMPIIVLSMARACTLQMGDFRVVMIAILIYGVHIACSPVLATYKPLVADLFADEPSGAFLNDRVYQVSHALNGLDVVGKPIYVCDDEDMIYVLTHALNPNYFTFKGHDRYPALESLLDVKKESISELITRTAPVAIVGRKGGRCLQGLKVQLKQHYRYYTYVQGMYIYARDDNTLTP